MARNRQSAMQKQINKLTGTNVNLTQNASGKASYDGVHANAQMQTMTDAATGKAGRGGRLATRSQRGYDIKVGIRNKEIEDAMAAWEALPEGERGMTRKEALAAARSNALSIG